MPRERPTEPRAQLAECVSDRSVVERRVRDQLSNVGLQVNRAMNLCFDEAVQGLAQWSSNPPFARFRVGLQTRDESRGRRPSPRRRGPSRSPGPEAIEGVSPLFARRASMRPGEWTRTDRFLLYAAGEKSSRKHNLLHGQQPEPPQMRAQQRSASACRRSFLAPKREARAGYPLDSEGSPPSDAHVGSTTTRRGRAKHPETHSGTAAAAYSHHKLDCQVTS
jgi:hypothetical protein